MKLLIATIKHVWKDTRMQMIVPLTIYSGLEQAFVFGDFTAVSVFSCLRINTHTVIDKAHITPQHTIPYHTIEPHLHFTPYHTTIPYAPHHTAPWHSTSHHPTHTMPPHRHLPTPRHPIQDIQDIVPYQYQTKPTEMYAKLQHIKPS